MWQRISTLKTMKPLYSLLYGIAGVSNALKVAEKAGMPSAIIEKSQSYLGKQEYVLNDLIQGLEREKKEAEEERQHAHLYREEMRKRLETLKQRRDEYLKDAQERLPKKGGGAGNGNRGDKERGGQEGPGCAQGGAGKGCGRKEENHPREKGRPDGAGEGRLRQGKNDRQGRLRDGLDEEKRMAEVIIGNMRMRINKEYVEKAQRQPGAKEERVNVNVAEIEVPEINVRGMRVDEALEEVDRFMDRAIVHGTSRLKILHGIGTGRLMTAIRSHLSEAGYVKDVIRDEKNSGMTIVELR